MSLSNLVLYALVAAVGTFVTAASLRAIWFAIGAYRISRAGPRRMSAGSHAIWREPGNGSSLNLTDGPGGRDGSPAPPFTFVEEHANGSQPCVSVTDARGRRWRVKWGNEVRSENFAVRLAWGMRVFRRNDVLRRAGPDRRRARPATGPYLHRRGLPLHRGAVRTR